MSVVILCDIIIVLVSNKAFPVYWQKLHQRCPHISGKAHRLRCDFVWQASGYFGVWTAAVAW